MGSLGTIDRTNLNKSFPKMVKSREYLACRPSLGTLGNESTEIECS